MSARLLPTKAQLDACMPQLEECARKWAEQECLSFDAEVLASSPSQDADNGSIWDMPAIDSKRVVALLADFEQIIGGGCKLPVSAIKSGGYSDADDLVARLLPKLREKCPDANKPGVVSTTPSPVASKSVPPQALP